MGSRFINPWVQIPRGTAMNNGIGFKTLCSLLFFVVLIGIQIGNWTRADKATDTLEAEGYTEIVPGDHSWFVCGQGDVSATSFAATNPLGKRVTGTVCCGLFKGCTVRY